MITDEKMVAWATEYLVMFAGTPIFITRHTNHHGWVEGGLWMVCHVRGSMNPWYLSADGFWRYKFGSGWKTAREAMEFLETRAKPPGTMAPEDAKAAAS